MLRPNRALPLLILLVASGASGETRPTPKPAETPEPGPQPATDLAALEWMTGYWAADSDAGHSEELWLPAKGHMMLGVHRDSKESGPAFYEYLRIENRKLGITYVASPRGAKETEFRLTESSSKKAVFENPEHDFPRRITYWLDEEGNLHARIDGGPDSDKSQEWTWRRATLGPAVRP